MAVEFAPLGINVNAVNGGIIETDSSRLLLRRRRDAGPATTQVLPKIPKGRMGTVKEVADTVEFLLEPRSEYITGQSLVVDGGLTHRRAAVLRRRDRAAAAARGARTRPPRPMPEPGEAAAPARSSHVFTPVRDRRPASCRTGS